MGREWFASVHILGLRRWEALAGGRSFASFEWMSFGEQVYASADHHYLVIGARGGPGSAVVSSLRNAEPLPVRQRLMRFLAAGWVARFPLMLCQLPVAGVSGLLFGEGIPHREAALRDAVVELKGLLAARGGSFLIFPYLTHSIAHSPVWGDEFLRASLPPGMALPIIWHDFEEYLFSRRNSVRKDYRLHVNRAARLGLTTRLSDRLPDLQTGIRLIRGVEKRHRTAPNPVVERMVSAAPHVGGKWLVVEQEGRLVGCGLILPDRGECLLTLLGLDRAIPQVYFALMYGAVQYAIESGASVLHGGGGAYRFKTRLGYRAVDTVHIRAFASHPVLRWLGGLLARSEAEGAAAMLQDAPAARTSELRI